MGRDIPIECKKTQPEGCVLDDESFVLVAVLAISFISSHACSVHFLWASTLGNHVDPVEGELLVAHSVLSASIAWLVRLRQIAAFIGGGRGGVSTRAAHRRASRGILTHQAHTMSDVFRSFVLYLGGRDHRSQLFFAFGIADGKHAGIASILH
jgi:hypothetical protein